MASFKDRNGRSWTVEITVGIARRIKTATGVNLMTLTDKNFEGMDRLLTDPVDLCNVLYLLCETQAKAAGISDEQFGEGLAGESLWSANEAFQAAFLDFFPNRGAVETMRLMQSKTRDLMDLMRAQANKTIETADLSEVAKKLNGQSGNTPASSESAPTPSPSVN